MWFFNSPEIIYGEGALSYLREIEGKRAFIVTDANILKLGLVDKVIAHLKEAGVEARVFSEVEPNPSIEVVKRGAAAMSQYGPDWVIGLGGGSAMDAAKAMWVLYERPDMEPEAINPMETLGLRKKARLITIPTTSGTGAEVTWFVVLTDIQERRKLALGSREVMADMAIVDPLFVAQLPPRLTADTGMDAVTHAIEGYACAYHNDFSDGLALKAIQLIFNYLPRAYAEGDAEAREKMHSAATIAGLAFGNSWAALAHGLGHSLGAIFHIPHGRAVGLFLPYTIEFTANQEGSRYVEIARFLGLDTSPGALVEAIRNLARCIDQPASIHELRISQEDFEAALPKLIENAEGDNATFSSLRIPSAEEFERLFRYAFEGKSIDF